MKYYKAYYSTWNPINPITEVDVDRVTDQSVFVGGRRNAMTTDREAYRETFALAKEWLTTKAQTDLDQAEESAANMRSVYKLYSELTESKVNL
jgi:hypothetical protein